MKIHAVDAVDNVSNAKSLEKSYGESIVTRAVHLPYRRRRAIGLRKRFRILHKCGFRCYYCGKSARRAELEVDHIHALARGGTEDEANLVAACFKCNRGKADGPSVEAGEDLGPCSVRSFIEACTVPGRDTPRRIYARFVEWVELAKLAPMSQTAFGRKLTELGHLETRSSGSRYRPFFLKPREQRSTTPSLVLDGRVRYYLHGDVAENDPTLIFCVKCDTFEERAHFTSKTHSAFSPDTDLERFERSRVLFYARPTKSLRNYHRPAGAPNIFEEA